MAERVEAAERADKVDTAGECRDCRWKETHAMTRLEDVIETKDYGPIEI